MSAYPGKIDVLRPIRAVTIKQPWIDLILAHEKYYEFRRWAPTDNTVRHLDVIALHESKVGIVGYCIYVRPIVEIADWRERVSPNQPGFPIDDWNALTDRETEKWPWKAWMIGLAHRIETIECPGKQGIWALPPDVTAEFLPAINEDDLRLMAHVRQVRLT